MKWRYHQVLAEKKDAIFGGGGTFRGKKNSSIKESTYWKGPKGRPKLVITRSILIGSTPKLAKKCAA